MTVATYKWTLERYHHAVESGVFKDLQVKSKVYAEVNITEYWLINLRDRQLIAYSEPIDGEYSSQAVITPKSFPSMQIDVRQLI